MCAFNAGQEFESSKMHLTPPPPPRAYASVLFKVVDSLLIVALTVCWIFLFCPCFCYAVLRVLSGCAMILTGKRALLKVQKDE